MNSQENIWNSLAEQWNRFRSKPFPETVLYLSRTWKNGKLLDIGCGNGRNLISFAEKDFICEGIDFSIEMVKNAKSKFKKLGLKAKFHASNMTKLPFKDNSFDYLICIASFHHLNKLDQEKALDEFKRILKPGGKMYITTWNKWQSKFLFSEKEIFVPWKVGDKTYQRYYYLFNYYEFKNLLSKYFKIESADGKFGKNIELIVKN
jgi:ubiquinone/menaquinone biosynthesis C-methylase UbiE